MHPVRTLAAASVSARGTYKLKRRAQEFIAYAQRHPGVVFMRKVEIAKFALVCLLTAGRFSPARGFRFG